MTVKLLSKLPDRDSPMNGLEPYSEQITQSPGTPRVAVVVLHCDSTEVKTASGVRNHVMQITQIEMLPELTDAEQALSLLNGARDRRSGQTALDIPIGEDPRPPRDIMSDFITNGLVRSGASGRPGDGDAPYSE